MASTWLTITTVGLQNASRYLRAHAFDLVVYETPVEPDSEQLRMLAEIARLNAAPPVALLVRSRSPQILRLISNDPDRTTGRLSTSPTGLIPLEGTPAPPHAMQGRRDPARKRADSPNQADEILEIIGRRFQERALTVADLAHTVGLTRQRLTQIVRTTTGQSPLQHIHRYRVQAAAWSLAETDASVYVAAIDAGYRSHKELCRWFNRLLGRTPSAWAHATRPTVPAKQSSK